jgi:hypothetical protein
MGCNISYARNSNKISPLQTVHSNSNLNSNPTISDPSETLQKIGIPSPLISDLIRRLVAESKEKELLLDKQHEEASLRYYLENFSLEVTTASIRYI